MSNYLVTGAAGFIGSRVTEMLIDQGHTVTGVDNLNDAYDVRMKEYRLRKLQALAGFSFQKLDISDRAAVQDLPSFEAVINLAARAGVRASVENPWIFVETNVTGTLNMLELCRRKGIHKFILASTSSIYGANAPLPTPETADSDRPLQPYAASKKAAEVLGASYHALYGIDVSVVRYFTVYGPAGRPEMSMFRFTKWISEGDVVHLYGTGEQSRGFTYVDDIARGTIAALKPLGYEIINLGGHEVITMNALVHLLEEHIGRKALIESHPANPADMYANQADVNKAGKLLDWQPKIGLEEGVYPAGGMVPGRTGVGQRGCHPVTIFQQLSAIWKEDNLLRRIVRNSSYLFGSNVISAVLSFGQTIIAVRLLGVTSWGLVAVIQTFASNINRFLSFRMSEVVVKHLGKSLVEEKKQEAAALSKSSWPDRSRHVDHWVPVGGCPGAMGFQGFYRRCHNRSCFCVLWSHHPKQPGL